MLDYSILEKKLTSSPRRWLVTGGAGFIGSHLIEQLLLLGQEVISLDNFSTGYTRNLELAQANLTAEQQSNLKIIEGDICDAETCRTACKGVDYIFHQAALGSVPGSIDDPVTSHDSNVSGTVNIFSAAREELSVKRIVYASSSAVYGDEPTLPKAEDLTGNLLSPYAANKAICEMYQDMFSRCYNMEIIGLRYFNVFGSRQDPNGGYAAVIPLWIQAMMSGEQVYINGDGETSRDFIHVSNVVQANLLAATSGHPSAVNNVYNIATGEKTTLNDLFQILRSIFYKIRPELIIPDAVHRDFRDGDIAHSVADISQAIEDLGFSISTPIKLHLLQTIEEFTKH